MKIQVALIFCFYFLFNSNCFAQHVIVDSCGLDSNAIVNKYENDFINNFLLYPRYEKKKGSSDTTKSFVFTEKKVAFFSCYVNSMTKGKGILFKNEFFKIVKTNSKGHAGIGFFKFNEHEKIDAGGFDGIFVIDCPYDMPNNKKLIKMILEKYKLQ